MLRDLALAAALVCAATNLAPSFAQSASAEDARHDVQHHVLASDGEHEARNVGQQYVARFDGRGVHINPGGSAWTLELALQSCGRGAATIALADEPAVVALDRRIDYAWSAQLTEWFVNTDRGLEHGFTLSSAPAGDGELVLELALRGGLVAKVASDGRSAELRDAEGATRATYAGLLAFDALGRICAARLEATASGLAIRVDDDGAVYPLTIDPILQQAYLKASNTNAGDLFGVSTGMSVDTIVVGAWSEASGASGVNGNQADNSAFGAGAAYVFVRSGSSWTQQAYLKASNTNAGDGFGASVGISGDTIVIGAHSEDSSAIGIGGNQADNNAIFAGAAYVFTRTGSTWTQQAYLKPLNTDPNDRFGSSVAIAGETIVVGAPYENGSATTVDGDATDNGAASAGAAHVFVRSGTTWTQQAYLKASNTDAGDRFGASVAIAGDTIVVGADLEDSSATGVGGNQASNASLQAGAAYVFVRNGTAWSQQAYVKASNTGANDRFGVSVDVAGNTIVVGAPQEDSAATGIGGDGSNNSLGDSGAAYVFARAGTMWSQQAYLKASNTGANDHFGQSVAVLGNTALVGAVWESGASTGVGGAQASNLGFESGAAYLFARTGSSWSQRAYLKASNTGGDDEFGTAVALAGTTAVVSAIKESSSAVGIGGNQLNNSAPDAGAVYVFELDSDYGFVQGCTGNTAHYLLPSAPAKIGTTVPVQLVAGIVPDGIVATYFGAASVDAVGCGVLLAPTQELLLGFAPVPQLLGLTAMTAGLATQPMPVPNVAGIVGFRVTLQSGVVDPITLASEVSDGLEFVIRP